MSSRALEQTVVERLAADLRAEGYEVVRDPRGPVLPPFMGTYRPDLVAFGRDGNVAVEVKMRHERSKLDVSRLTKLFEGRKDWEFRVFWVPVSDEEEPLRPQSIADIGRALSDAEALTSQGNPDAGFLLAWAVFEALGRRMLADRFVRPQTPGRLIEVMAGEGVLTPDEATRLRSLVPFRNRLIHGELDARLDAAKAKEFLVILRNLLEMAGEPA